MKWPRRGALIERRLRWSLTWRGWLLALVVVAAAGVYAFRHALDFLTVRDVIPSRTLVVESWIVDMDLSQVVAAYGKDHYDRVFLTGGPLARSDPMHRYLNYPELMATDLIEMGVPAETVIPVPAPWELRDRTFTSALALRRWFETHGGLPPSLDIVTTAPHSRRTRLMFEHALGDRVKVGMIPLEPTSFDAKHWWRSSEGVKDVLVEVIGYLYARVQVAWLTAS